MSRPVYSAVYLLLLSLCFSCSLKPKYCRPDAPIPEEYRFSFPNNEAYANLPWWEQFEDPVLNELIKTALKNNQNLQAATATVLQFYAQYQVIFSQLFPQINAQGNASRNKLNANGPSSSNQLNASFVYSFYQLFVNLTYELDFWGKIRNAVDSAHAQYLAQVDARWNVILSIVSALAKGYILLLQYDNQMNIAQDTLNVRTEMWKVAKLRYEAGLTSAMELKQAESQVEDAEVQLKSYQVLIPIQEDLISILLGNPPGPIPRGKLLEDLKLPPAIPAGLPSDLLENRPDILQAEQNLISSSALIGVARASFFPQFSLTGTEGQQAYEFNNLFKSINNYFNLQINALQPLYTGGQLTAQLREAEAVFLENYHIYQQTVLTALQEVSDALISHKVAKEQIEILFREEAALAEYLRLANLRYFNGQNDYLTVTVAEQDYFTVQLQTEMTRGTVFSSLIDVFTALGQGWDVEADYCEKCNDPSPLWDALF